MLCEQTLGDDINVVKLVLILVLMEDALRVSSEVSDAQRELWS